MVPEHLRFGGGVGDTVISPVVAVILIIVGVLIFILPQKKAIVPFLLTSILIPGDQVLVVAGLHFPLLRLLIPFGIIRIFIIKGRGEWDVFSGGLNRVDKLMVALSVTSAVTGVLLFQNTQALVFQLGGLYDAFGTYFVLRCLIRDHEDVVRVIRVLAFIVLVLGVVMTVEQLTKGWNPYVLLEGARASAHMERDGRVRAMGSFAQPILAGMFGAVMVPLFVGIWLTEKRYRFTAVAGIVGAAAMVIASNSSTPLFGLLAGLSGLCFWPFRSLTRLVRWAVVIMLVSLHMVMKAPVWHLITRIDVSGSSYHRYELIDKCIRHFWDWWLIGTKSNADWGWDMWDTANQYVQTAQNSGLLALVCLLGILVFGFKYLGKARQATTDKKFALFIWALEAALFAQAISFFGISLWDQSIVGWYALLAFIGTVAAPHKLNALLPQRRPELSSATESTTFAPANQLASRWR